MKKYLNPEINIKMLDFEDITTESGIASKTAVEVAEEVLGVQEDYEITDVLVMS